MATASSTYYEVLDAIGRYYGTGSDEWVEFAKYNLHADNLAEVLRQVPGVDVHVNKAGEVIGYSVNNNIPLTDGGTSLPAVNSNVQTGTAATSNTTTISTLGNFTSDPQTGDVSSTQQIPKKTGGVASTAVAGICAVASTVMAAGIGLKFGRWVNNELYENNPTFWRDLTDTPEGSEARAEWERITAAYDEIDKDGNVTHFLNAIAGVDDTTKKATVYADENALAYYAWQLKTLGFFDEGGAEREPVVPVNNKYTPVSGMSLESLMGIVIPRWVQFRNNPFTTYEVTPAELYSALETAVANKGIILDDYVWYFRGYQSTGEAIGLRKNVSYDTITSESASMGSVISLSGPPRQGNVVWIYMSVRGSTSPFSWHVSITTNESGYICIPSAVAFDLTGTSSSGLDVNNMRPFGSLTAGTSNGCGASGVNAYPTSAIPGVESDPNATLPSTTGWDSPADTLASLKNQYPEWWDDAYENDVIGENGEPKKVTYIPIPMPANYTNGNPLTQDNPSTQQNPEVDPDNPSVTDDLLRTIIAILTKPATDPATITDPKTDDPTNTNPNPPDTGGGTTPPIVVPVGSASALWAVYNPTQAEINSLGAWLWSNNFVDQLLKMFNDPMQAIIGLHKTFIPPITGSAQDIKVGYLNSGVSALTVPVQYSSVDCGTIDCAEYFGNVFDYAPYTRIYLYLPFIGFKELDVAQVMRSRINVKYHGDAFTGTCLAEVAVNRDGESGGVLYTYSGDCAARYPLSHGSYMGIVSGVVGVATSTAMALGGMMNPIMGLGGIVGSAMGARNKVEHSGGFSGNSGAMGIKKPYLVIMRPQTAMARNYEHFTGQPSNSNVVLGSASGYVRVKECHVEDIATATDAEKQMIESALKTGVII